MDLAGLRAANPRLVTVSVGAFGGDGPKAGWSATDLIVLAAGGQLVLTGDADRAPVRISLPQAWLHAAAEAAVGGLVALWERASSGLGQHVDVSAQQCVMECTQTSMLSAAVGAPEYNRVAGGIKVGPYTLRLVYPALDGHVSITFLFGSMIGPYTHRLMSWVHDEGYCDAATRDLNWVEFFNLIFSGQLDPSTLDRATDAVAAFTATKTKVELLHAALSRRLLIAPVATTADVLASEQLEAREFWDEVDGVRYPGPFAKASRVALRRLGAPPQLGELDGVPLRPSSPAPAAPRRPRRRELGPAPARSKASRSWT